VALPLRLESGMLGVVTLVSRAPHEREPGLGRLLETMTAHLAQYLHRRTAERRAAARAEDLSTLARVAHALATQNDMYAARNELCAAVRDVTGATSVVLWEPGEAPDTLCVSAAVGAAVRGMTLDLEHVSAAGAAFLTGDPMFVPDVAADPRVSLNWHDVTGAVSGAWFPAVHDGRCVGVLAVGWPRTREALAERDEELLRLLAAQAAVTIHRTALLDRLRETARTDALTGLPNRRVWEEDLGRELARARRHGGSLCLVMLDLDRFKAFNDAHGHPAGDRLLADTAAAWRPIMRATDTLARYGGEEFAVLLPHSELPAAEAVVERLLDAVPLAQTASAGVAVWDGEESAEALLERADAALYAAKHAGRACAVTAA
jgi:diguanylate cyclase (GGDEF)-like protein